MELDLETEIDSIVNNEIYSNQAKGELNLDNKELLDTKDDSYFSFSNSIVSVENENENETNTPKFNFRKLLAVKNTTKIISSCERRIMKDLEEIKKNTKIGKICEVKINDYKRVVDTDNFYMIIEFKNYFSTKFEFLQDYPFSPPIITFHSGKIFPEIFDSNGNILLENSNKINWTPILWLSTLIFSIEMLILKCSRNYLNNPFSMIVGIRKKYKKRNWNDYLEGEKSLHSTIPKELFKTIKQLKISN